MCGSAAIHACKPTQSVYTASSCSESSTHDSLSTDLQSAKGAQLKLLQALPAICHLSLHLLFSQQDGLLTLSAEGEHAPTDSHSLGLLETLLTAHVSALQALLTVNDESMYMKMNLANQMMASRGLVPQGRWLGYMMTAHMLEGDLAVSPGDPCRATQAVHAVALADALAPAPAGRQASAEGNTRLPVSRCSLAET